MREQKANDNGFPVVGKQAKEQQIFPFEQLVEYDGATNKITINANLTINGDTNIGELDIDSGDAPKGQVLTANGQSGASWENRVEYLNLESESGNLTNAQIEVAEQDNVVIQLGGQFYYKNSQSDESIVFKAPAKVVDDDTIAEKVVVDLSDNTYSYSYEVVAAGNSFEPTYDDELNDSSTNAPQTKVVYAALEEKANVDGNYSTMTVGLANNLVATKGLTVNDDPMSYGMVGGSQNSAVGDGNATLNKLVCVDVVKNQQFHPTGAFPLETNGVTITKVGDKLILNGTATANTNFPFSGQKITKGHIYFRRNLKSNGLRLYSVYALDDMSIVTAGDNDNYLSITVPEGVTLSNYEYNGFCIDLTQRYGDNEVVNAIIGSDTSKEQVARLLAFDPKILNNIDYNDGTLVPSKTAKLLSVGVNQWDEETELGSIGSDGQNVASSSVIRSKNYIKVIPNTTYYIYGSNNIGGIYCYDKDKNFITSDWNGTTPNNCAFIRFKLTTSYGTTYNHDICINISNPNINGKYYPTKRNQVALPNYEGHGILKVVDGKVVADGTELYPDGNSKGRYGKEDLGIKNWTLSSSYGYAILSNPKRGTKNTLISKLPQGITSYVININNDAIVVYFPEGTFKSDSELQQAMSGVYLVFLLATEEDITTQAYQSTLPVEQGGTLQFLDENDNSIAGLQGNEIFYQKNIKTFVEALGEATDWNPERIKRLGDLSFTPETADIVLNPSPVNAYAKVQVMSSTFTIVVSAVLTGTASGSITFQDSEVDLTNFQTKPAKAIYDMDGKKVSEAPTTTDCNIASFVGRSYNGVVLWSILHSGVNKIKIHFEQAVPLDENGNGKVDCRASLIL